MKRILFASLQLQLLWTEAITAASMVPPAGHDTPICSARSESPSTFKHQEHQLGVMNPATNYTTKYRLNGLQLAPDPFCKDPADNAWTPCEDRTLVPGEGRYYTIDTDVLFQRQEKLTRPESQSSAPRRPDSSI
ncbi:hypothetical protein F5B18DRAFT_656008 [Nemania serpens]|nr:hypothetical protein F5B18DRAFT_656008 [Nemania serpens]